MALKDMRSPLARVRGAGSAHDGTLFMKKQHLALFALVPLLIYSLVSFFACVAFKGGGYQEAVSWVRFPLNALALILTLSALFYHAAGGVQEIIEDYLHGWKKCFAGFVVKFGAAGLALSGVLSVLKVFLGV